MAPHINARIAWTIEKREMDCSCFIAVRGKAVADILIWIRVLPSDCPRVETRIWSSVRKYRADRMRHARKRIVRHGSIRERICTKTITENAQKLRPIDCQSPRRPPSNELRIWQFEGKV